MSPSSAKHCSAEYLNIFPNMRTVLNLNENENENKEESRKEAGKGDKKTDEEDESKVAETTTPGRGSYSNYNLLIE